jgi:hypothetical protein
MNSSHITFGFLRLHGSYSLYCFCGHCGLGFPLLFGYHYCVVLAFMTVIRCLFWITGLILLVFPV